PPQHTSQEGPFCVPIWGPNSVPIDIQQQQYEAESQAAALQAEQQEAEVQRQAQRARSAIVAMRAGSGLDPFSVTGREILAENDDEAAADLETIKANAGYVQRRNQLASQAATTEANSRISQAGYASTGALVGGIGRVASSGYSTWSSVEKARRPLSNSERAG
ncbi:hypothetical protein, partial [Roseomonas mucosa]|uniref:hypothetical protein n=1 Tax=Roseomonas mucosa TaxID=207340 RepID=UPI001C0C89FC